MHGICSPLCPLFHPSSVIKSSCHFGTEIHPSQTVGNDSMLGHSYIWAVNYSVYGMSLCTYKRCWKWCPRVSIQAWTRLILFANTFYRSACEMFLMNAVIAVFNSLSVCGRSRYTADFATMYSNLRNVVYSKIFCKFFYFILNCPQFFSIKCKWCVYIIKCFSTVHIGCSAFFLF
jgi:hypothetical protein